jgi:hypothetical protein
LNNLTVKCYSGYIYAEEPRSFEWGGVAYEIKEIERAWQEPGSRHFKVKTKDNKFFELCYNEAEEGWSLTEVRR